MTRHPTAFIRRFDPASWLTVKRFLCTLVLFAAFAGVARSHAFAAALAVMAAAAACVESLIALLTGERPLAPTLNRWDVSLAFFAVHALAKFFS
jgi:hypothetical protein